MYPSFLLLTASALLLLVAGWDMARRRIPNWVNAALAATGLLAQLTAHGGWEAAGGLGAAAISLLLLWTPWATRRLGGGDVKAVLGASIWIGIHSLVSFYLVAAIAGGLFALASVARSSATARLDMAQNLKLVLLRHGLPNVSIRGGDGRISVPFGAAAAAAAVLLLWWR